MDYKQIDEHSAVIRTLKENDIKIKPKGYSMYPLFVPGRDRGKGIIYCGKKRSVVSICSERAGIIWN